MPFPLFFALAGALGANEVLTKRRKKGQMLAAEAERQDTLNDINLGIGMMGEANAFDRRRKEILQQQLIQGQVWAASKDPRQQAAGYAMLARVDEGVLRGVQQNETEARADKIRQQDQEVLQAGIGFAAEEKRFQRGLVMNKQLNDDLKPFQDSLIGYNKVINLLDTNDQIASMAALVAFIRGIDDSVVRRKERMSYEGANGLIIKFVNAVNKAEGKDFDEATRQSIRNAASALVNAQKSGAIVIANSYRLRATAFGLDPNKVLSGVDSALFTPIAIDSSAQEALEQRQAEADAAEATFTKQEGLLVDINIPFTDKRIVVNPAANIVHFLVKPFIDIIEGVGGGLRGETVYTNDLDGTPWIEDRFGVKRPVTNQDYINAEQDSNQGGVQFTEGLQRRIDEQEREDARKRREERNLNRPPGLFQEGGFFDR